MRMDPGVNLRCITRLQRTDAATLCMKVLYAIDGSLDSDSLNDNAQSIILHEKTGRET